MTLAAIHHLDPDDDRRLEAFPRDGRLAEARRELAEARAERDLLRRIIGGEFEAWADLGAGQVYLYDGTHICEVCDEEFVTEDDEAAEAPAWMTADFLRLFRPIRHELAGVGGIAIRGVALCEACAEREGI